MRMNYTNSTKCIGILLFLLAISFTAPATEQLEWVERNGLLFELAYDDETGEGEARLLFAMPDQHIVYGGAWGPDSMLYLPTMIDGDFYSFPLTSIMDNAFSGCQDLKEVHIPTSITQIGEYAFHGSNLETIYSDYSMDPIAIGEAAFRNCNRLKYFALDRPLYQISNYMFMNCPQLNTLYFFDSNAPLDTIGACAFANCVGMTYMNIPNSVKTIRKGAFANCYNLKRVALSGGITTIEKFAFAECHALTNLVFYDSMTSIGEGAFLNCHALTTVVIPNQIKKVEKFAFYGCSGLKNLYASSVTSFGERAFAGCNSLTEIDLSNAPDIEVGAFLGGHVYCELWNTTNLTDTSNLEICVRSENHSVNEGSLRQITLSDKMTEINDLSFAGHVPDTITCMAPAPPVYTRADNYDLVFSTAAYSTTVLRVPLVLVNSYHNAYGWKRFNNIQGIAIVGNGDANDDGSISIGDVTTLIDKLLGGSFDTFNMINADVNGDGNISVADVTALIDKLLGAE